MSWAVYQRNYRITKVPMTEYDAKSAQIHWEKMLSNVEVREIKPEVVDPPKIVVKKPRKKKRERMCWG